MCDEVVQTGSFVVLCCLSEAVYNTLCPDGCIDLSVGFMNEMAIFGNHDETVSI